MQARAVAILGLSYLNVVKGMRWLLSIGVATLLLGWLDLFRSSEAFLVAGVAFASVFPAFFAGIHFRVLASRRTFTLLPGFAGRMIAAVLLLLVAAATVGGVVAGPLLGLDPMTGTVVAAGFYSFVFWVGFLPYVLRFLLTGLLILSAIHIGDVDSLTPSQLGILGIAMVLAWMVFAGWFRDRVERRRTFDRGYTLPGTRIFGNEMSVGTPEGTLLLGTTDAVGPRAAMAAIKVIGLPTLFLVGFSVAASLPPERVLGSPIILFLGLSYAFVGFLELASRVGSRCSLLWLRIDTGQEDLVALCGRLLIRELAFAGAALSILIAVMIAIHPPGWSVLLAFSAMWLTALVPHLHLGLRAGRSVGLRFWLAAVHLLALTVIVVAVREGAPVSLMWIAATAQLILSATISVGIRRGVGR